MLLLSALLLPALQQSLAGQLPKEDLGVAAFLAANPEYDGRGIRVAVLDTGVDPGHPFLQATPDGRRKLVDWYDATTDGRLDTSYTVELDGNGNTIGLSGRRLDFGDLAGAGQTVHLGRLGAEFLPHDLSGRIHADRQGEWAEGKQLYDEAITRLKADGVEVDEESAAEMEQRHRWSSFQEDGPVYDVAVVQVDGEWQVVLDSDEDGSFADEQALRSFRESGDWAVLGDEANMNYAVGISDDGNLVTLFFDTHGHGTHVAGIIGSYEGPDSRLNGIAPGVEIVAIKIGDGKFGGSTSGFAVAKGLDYAVEAGCQIANMSFGGPSFYADGREPDGWVIEEAAKRGLLLVTSAGNEGPTLSTVGSPATSEPAFSIAAAVWPDTQKVNYGSLATSPPVLFDFSSRGPLPSGDLGIDFTAPGAALSALPSWGLSKGESWNGTSMAAPQMAGCVALLMGAGVAEGLPHGQSRLHRALRLSAKPMPQHAWVEVGHGFIDMTSSLEHLRALAAHGADEMEYDLSVQNPFGVGEGIYLRGVASDRPVDRTVRVRPHFDEDVSNAEKSDFLATLRLVSESDWVQVPDAVYTSAQGNAFKARVLPASLKPGLHSTRILAYDDSKEANAGPELVIPVTVVIPTMADDLGEVHRQFQLSQGQLERTFLQVPYGARRAMVRVTQHGGTRSEYRSGAGSVSGFLYSGDRQARGRFFLADGDTYETSFPVEAGMVVEYTIASRWATNTEAQLDLDIRFEGVQPGATAYQVPAGQEMGFFGFASLLRDENGLSGSADVQGVAIPVTTAWDIQPDPIRSTILGGHGMFQGVVEWQEEVPEGVSNVTLYTPNSMPTTEWREDLALEVFNAEGAVVTRGIVYEDETPIGALEPGTYHFRLSYPSLGQDSLQAQFAGAELRFYRGLGSVALYPSLKSAFDGDGGSGRLSIPFQGARTLFARMPELEALPAGQYYFGSVSVDKSGTTLVEVPLQVFRPQSAEAMAEARLAQEEAQSGPSEQETAWAEAKAAGMESPVQWIQSARDWQQAEPLDFRAELAVYEALVAAGLPEEAKRQAVGFLQRFPHQAAEFLQAAKAWN